MEKPKDRLNPQYPKGPWSNMEEWGGKSWFTAKQNETPKQENKNS